MAVSQTRERQEENVHPSVGYITDTLSIPYISVGYMHQKARKKGQIEKRQVQMNKTG